LGVNAVNPGVGTSINIEIIVVDPGAVFARPSIASRAATHKGRGLIQSAPLGVVVSLAYADATGA
jgi:hypothetical protein